MKKIRSVYGFCKFQTKYKVKLEKKQGINLKEKSFKNKKIFLMLRKYSCSTEKY